MAIRKYEHFLITGCGNSGTRYYAKIFTDAFGLERSHERVFTQMCYKEGYPLRWRKNVGDASCHGAAYDLPADCLKIHLIRDPFRQIFSTFQLKWFEGRIKPSLGYLYDICPEVFSHLDPLARTAQYWISWNKKAAEKAQYQIKLEFLNIEATKNMLMHFGVGWSQDARRGFQKVPKQFGKRASYGIATLRDFPDLQEEVYTMRTQYGYPDL